MIIELERTRKKPSTIEIKLCLRGTNLKQNIQHDCGLSKWKYEKICYEQIKAYNWKLEQHHIEIFNR
ncbi:MAG: hypothetical protein FCO83_02815 [Spiroplasma sp. WSS]|nr:MAG: hypothetical protein FCO83_02815 [Spiroplasma sp. WSS]